jgi:superfamily II DNA or RNA helicase
VAQDYARSWRLGLTATPQRGDGTPLGDVFDSLVVAAQYSELLADGHLVPCRVIRPDGPIEDGLAQNPVEAWKAHAGDRQGFIFGHRVDKCYEYARALTAAGFPTEVIEGNTAADIRAEHLREFKAGRLRALCSVYVLTEGIDVPVASVCLLARKAGHTGTYLQMVGRVLRPAPGKTDALLIDLAGTSYHHGLPTDDREYALSGRSIRTLGQVREAAEESEKRADKPLVIYSRELREVYAGDETPVEARRAEWNRLVDLCQQRKWAIGWAAKQYRTLFKAPPPATWVPPAMRAAQVQAWKARASEKSYKPGWVRVMEREAFG